MGLSTKRRPVDVAGTRRIPRAAAASRRCAAPAGDDLCLLLRRRLALSPCARLTPCSSSAPSAAAAQSAPEARAGAASLAAVPSSGAAELPLQLLPLRLGPAVGAGDPGGGAGVDPGSPAPRCAPGASAIRAGRSRACCAPSPAARPPAASAIRCRPSPAGASFPAGTPHRRLRSSGVGRSCRRNR